MRKASHGLIRWAASVAAINLSGTKPQCTLSILDEMALQTLVRIAVFVFFLPSLATSDISSESFGRRLARAAVERTLHEVTYDGAYVSIPYPGGDVASDKGVCTDVVIRAYRRVGIDLQVDVHEEMSANFGAFPAHWGLSRPDRNIDHRRVPNLRTLFKRKGNSLPVTNLPDDYAPGDIVTWRIGASLPHIGIVSAGRSEDGVRPLVVHNIGRGPQQEDVLFAYPITGHYRYGADRY